MTDSVNFQENKGNESEHINLKVLGQDNAVVQFKIKRHTPLRKLMNAYCDRAVSIKLAIMMMLSVTIQPILHFFPFIQSSI